LGGGAGSFGASATAGAGTAASAASASATGAAEDAGRNGAGCNGAARPSGSAAISGASLAARRTSTLRIGPALQPPAAGLEESCSQAPLPMSAALDRCVAEPSVSMIATTARAEPPGPTGDGSSKPGPRPVRKTTTPTIVNETSVTN